ncbi:MAG: TonB-dependent receptor [Rhodanobacteraceae bacterium]
MHRKSLATALSAACGCLIHTLALAGTSPDVTRHKSPAGADSAGVPTATTTDSPLTLDAVSVTAALNRARNGLSADTGSSEYVIDQRAVAQMPLGASTPLNQVILQAPGVVQDSFGQLHVRGDHANLQYRIDGVLLPESISGFGQTLDTRMIQSVKLLDGALPSQYGERTAAVVNITTKGGSELGNGGDAGITGGSFGTLNPFASIWGTSGRWRWYVTGNYLENDLGIENPAPRRKTIHNHTNQVKGFGDVSYIVNDDTRLSFMFGVANNRFQIPNDPGQEPEFEYLDRTGFNSADLDERQRELTRFGVLSLQGKLGTTDYQVSLGQRFSGVRFLPDTVGDLMFNGIAATIDQRDRASTLQADFAAPIGERNTLRYGIFGSHDRTRTASNSLVFPADADGEQTSTVPFGVFEDSRIIAGTLAAYVQDQWNIDDEWTVNIGVRGNQYKAFGRTQRQLSPRLGVVWQASDTTTVHAGYARYFTPPATELISAEDISRFDGTTHGVKNYGDNTPLAERSHYFDVGVSREVGAHLTIGLDAYYRKVTDLQDEGQFGAALIYSTFNYEYGRVRGVEFSLNYNDGPVSAWFNLAYNAAMGKHVVTSQYNFSHADLAYIRYHWIYLDHNQKLASSGGIGYAFGGGTRIGANYLFGTGMREDGLTPNGLSLPDHFQLNLSASRCFDVGGLGKVHAQLGIINVLGRVYALRSGTGIGVGAPQYGPRRGLYLTLSKAF